MNMVFNKMKEKTLLHIISGIQYGSLELTLPDGSTHHFTGKHKGPQADMAILHADGIKRMMRDGKMGFCEAYMDGLITSNRLAELIELTVLHNDYVEQQMQMNMLGTITQKLNHWRNANSRTGSARNIAYHYDLGNEFYQSWLDKSMTYSSAIFGDSKDTLETAQARKYEYLCQLADIQPGDKVLEIGCGWGGFAEYAASQKGTKVTGITISKAQYDFAVNRLKAAGLEDKTDIRLTDYRDIEGTFDKIISIEMFEAVGKKFWPTYFGKLAQSLKQGGIAALQLISIEHKSFASYESNPDFIQRYIFPGGMLPSFEALEAPLMGANLTLSENNGYGSDYAHTLRQWRERFLTAWSNELKDQAFDNRFKRMWELYLAYCEGGFNAGMIDVNQIALHHK